MDVDVSQGSMAPSAAHFDFHNSHVGIPFVDKSGDGATGFIYDSEHSVSWARNGKGVSHLTSPLPFLFSPQSGSEAQIRIRLL